DRHQEREGEDAPIPVSIGADWHIACARWHVSEQVPAPVGEQRADNAGEAREQDAFREQLANEPSAVRPDGRANPHLFLTYDGAREHEVGDVGAGDEQYQTYHYHENGADQWHEFHEGRFRPAILLARDEDLRFLVFLRIFPCQMSGDNLYSRAGLRYRHAGLQPGHHLENRRGPIPQHSLAVRASLAQHRGRHKRPRRQLPLRAAERLRRHSDNGEGMAIDVDHFADGGRIPAEFTLPVGMRQYDDRIRARFL